MTSIIARGRQLYAKIRDINGRWKRVRTGYVVGEEAQAKAWAEERDRELTRERERRATFGGPLTVAAFATRWLDARKTKTVRDDRTRIERHVLPRIGHMMLVEVTPMVVQKLVEDLRATTTLAPKTIREVASILHTMFKSARIQGLVGENPVMFERGVLPKKIDRDPAWRAQAIFTRAEIEQLLSDLRLPLQRRVTYALKFFCGRHTETTKCRWTNYDRTLAPLGCLHVIETKTGIPRQVPVHPTLAAILEQWWAYGWREAYDRDPEPDDLIVMTSRGNRLRAANTQKQFVRDLATLGLRVKASSLNRRGHDLRRTLITLARADGAIDSLLRWVTHGPKPGEILDVYSSPPWESLCGEVAKLRVRLLDGSRTLGPSEVRMLGPGESASESERPQRDSNTGALPDGTRRDE